MTRPSYKMEYLYIHLQNCTIKLTCKSSDDALKVIVFNIYSFSIEYDNYVFIPPANFVCGGYTLFIVVHLCVRVCVRNILLRSRRDIVLASSVRPSVHSVRPSGTISQYLLVRFDSFLVQMISTMDSLNPISLVKINPLSLELLPLF